MYDIYKNLLHNGDGKKCTDCDDVWTEDHQTAWHIFAEVMDEVDRLKWIHYERESKFSKGEMSNRELALQWLCPECFASMRDVKSTLADLASKMALKRREIDERARLIANREMPGPDSKMKTLLWSLVRSSMYHFVIETVITSDKPIGLRWSRVIARLRADLMDLGRRHLGCSYRPAINVSREKVLMRFLKNKLVWFRPSANLQYVLMPTALHPDSRLMMYNTTMRYDSSDSITLYVAPRLPSLDDLSQLERNAVLHNQVKLVKQVAGLIRLSCRDALKASLAEKPTLDDLLERDFDAHPDMLLRVFFEELLREPGNPNFSIESGPARAVLTSMCLKIMSHGRYRDHLSVSLAVALRQLSFDKLIEFFNNLFLVPSRSTVYRFLSSMKDGASAFLKGLLSSGKFCVISWDNLEFSNDWCEVGSGTDRLIRGFITIVYHIFPDIDLPNEERRAEIRRHAASGNLDMAHALDELLRDEETKPCGGWGGVNRWRLHRPVPWHRELDKLSDLRRDLFLMGVRLLQSIQSGDAITFTKSFFPHGQEDHFWRGFCS